MLTSLVVSYENLIVDLLHGTLLVGKDVDVCEVFVLRVVLGIHVDFRDVYLAFISNTELNIAILCLKNIKRILWCRLLHKVDDSGTNSEATQKNERKYDEDPK